MRAIAYGATLLIVSLFALSACGGMVAGDTPSQERVLSELTTCESGICWQGHALTTLTPQAVQNGVRQLKGYEGADIQQLWSEGDTSVHGWNPTGEIYVELVLRNDEPVVLARGPIQGVTLGQVIDRFGAPSHVLVQKYPNPELLLVAVDVIFEPLGLIFHALPAQGDHEFDVSSSLQIDSFTLSSSRKLSELVSSALYPLTEPPRVSLTNVGELLASLAQPWRNYGHYEVNVP